LKNKHSANVSFPKLDAVKDEETRTVLEQLVKILSDTFKNIADDESVLEKAEAYDTLPTAAVHYRGKLLILKHAGAGTDGLYLGIDSGGSPAFQVILPGS